MANFDLNNVDGMQFDVLRELGNIGAGNATTALSSMLNTKVDMNVPKVDLLGFDELHEIMGGAETIVVGIQVIYRQQSSLLQTMFTNQSILAFKFFRNSLQYPSTNRTFFCHVLLPPTYIALFCRRFFASQISKNNGNHRQYKTEYGIGYIFHGGNT